MKHISLTIPLYYCDTKLYQPIAKCLLAVANLKGQKEVIVIDDASPFQHGFMVTDRQRTNLGFTRTVNRGMKMAKGDIIVVMNDDILITQECFDRFRELKGLVIASPRDTASSDDDRFGACWGITREAYNLLGPLNETYKHFYSDVDYYERAKKAGVEIIKWEDIVLSHPESSTYKTLDKETLLKEDRERYDLGR